MSVVLSTGYAARSMLGGESFVDLFRDGVIELRGGPGIAPGVLAALRYGLEQDPDELV